MQVEVEDICIQKDSERGADCLGGCSALCSGSSGWMWVALEQLINRGTGSQHSRRALEVELVTSAGLVGTWILSW